MTQPQVPQRLSTHFPKSAHKPCCPPPRNSGQLLSEVEFSCQDAHRSPIQGSPDVDYHDNPAQSCAEEAVTRRNFKSHQLSLNQDPPSLKNTKDIQVCSALLTLFIYKKDTFICIDSVRRPCLFLSDHQMTCPRPWTYQEQSADMVANFGSMCKIPSGDTQT